MGVMLFKSTDTGASKMRGVAGRLIQVISECIIVHTVLQSTGDESGYTDVTAEARSKEGTPFQPFVAGATTNHLYVGSPVKFNSLNIRLGTAAVGGVFDVKYWNGTTWVSAGLADGTVQLTVDGRLTGGIPTGWVAKAINGVTLYWIRFDMSVAGSVQATFKSCSILGWLEAFGPTANRVGYLQGKGSAAAPPQLYLRVDDNGPGAGALEADLMGFETMTGISAVAAADGTQASAIVFCRKSASIDAVDREWKLLADDRTFTLAIAPGDAPGYYKPVHVGDIFSFTPNDAWRFVVAGQDAVAHTAGQSENVFAEIAFNVGTFSIASVFNAHWIARKYDASGTWIAWGKHGDGMKGASASGSFRGGVPYPNDADNGLYHGEITVQTATGIRGLLRGLRCPYHAATIESDGFTYGGTGPYFGQTFELLKNTKYNTNDGILVFETSDTWRTN